MKIIAGLGNPGKRYHDTPHNAGFAVLDRLAEQLRAGWTGSLKFRADLSRCKNEDDDILMVKPKTFMNQSGSSVAAVARYYNCALTDLLIVLDDADLPLGRIRFRPGGGSGGHRGLASILESLGAEDVPRLRIGIGRGGEDLIDHVLGRWRKDEKETMDMSAVAATDAALCWVRDGVAEAMNRFNGWTAGLIPTPTNDEKAEKVTETW